MSLLFENICPLLNQEVLKSCKSKGIRTTTDFIAADAEMLAEKIKISYKDVLSIQLSLMKDYAKLPQNALSLYHEILESTCILDTGSKRLNRCLGGGIYTGEVTEIHGLPGSGKSQFCFSLLSNLIFDSKSTAIYLDTSGNCVANRIEQILIQKSDNDQSVLKKLKNINIKNVYDIYDLFECLNAIKTEFYRKENSFLRYLKLLVIDSITPLLSPCFGGKYLDGLGLMGSLAHLLNALCQENELAIVVCNNTVQDKKMSWKPALGLNWKYVPSVSLCIEKVDGSLLYKLRTIKSCHKGSSEVTFNISKAGIADCMNN